MGREGINRVPGAVWGGRLYYSMTRIFSSFRGAEMFVFLFIFSTSILIRIFPQSLLLIHHPVEEQGV